MIELPFIVIFVVLMVVAGVLWIRNGKLKRKLESMEEDRERALAAARRDAVKRSRAVSIGKAVEHLVPFMPDFPYDPSDSRFLGSPVDFVVFDGLRDGDTVREVVFVEVKTGRSRLSGRERAVKDAVLNGRVSWREERSSE